VTRLEERREILRARFAELQWDIGGAAYEMAARDYFRLDVLAKMAARLQIVDAELAEIERLARLERAGASGSCPGCGSLHAQGAVYCWRCGRNLTLPAGRQALMAPAANAPNGTVVEAPTRAEPNGHSPDAGIDKQGFIPHRVDFADPGLDPELEGPGFDPDADDPTGPAGPEQSRG
jgi:hypothetical protein